MAGSIKDGPPSPSVNRSGGDQEPGDMAERTPVTEPTTENNANANGVAPNDQKPAATNAKDPTRPRRKKARRACFACQRAHLTCGTLSPVVHPHPTSRVPCTIRGVLIRDSQATRDRASDVSSAAYRTHVRTASGKRPSICTTRRTAL